MTTLNARANQAWDEHLKASDDVWSSEEKAAFEEGWETGYKTASRETAEAIAAAMESYPEGDRIRTSLAALLARQIGGVS